MIAGRCHRRRLVRGACSLRLVFLLAMCLFTLVLDDATRSGAEHRVVSRVVAEDASDNRPFNAALGAHNPGQRRERRTDCEYF